MRISGVFFDLAAPMRSVIVSHAVFATTCDFAPIWQPLPRGVPAREELIYLCAFISLASGIGLLWRRSAAPSSRLLLVYFRVVADSYRDRHWLAVDNLFHKQVETK